MPERSKSNDRIKWVCPGCSRTFRIPRGRDVSMCPECSRSQLVQSVEEALYAEDATREGTARQCPQCQKHFQPSVGGESDLCPECTEKFNLSKRSRPASQLHADRNPREHVPGSRYSGLEFLSAFFAFLAWLVLIGGALAALVIGSRSGEAALYFGVTAIVGSATLGMFSSGIMVALSVEENIRRNRIVAESILEAIQGRQTVQECEPNDDGSTSPHPHERA